MAHDHPHPPPEDGVRTAFLVAVGLNVTFVIFEVVFGFRSRSLALLSDAGHNLGDVLGLLLAWGAILLARQASSARRTCGLRRSTILAALANAVVLLVAVGAVALEAVQRLRHPAPIFASTVVAVAALGILVNGLSAWLLGRNRRDDLNVRAAVQHLVADTAVSFGVVLAGVALIFTDWLWLAPLVPKQARFHTRSHRHGPSCQTHRPPLRPGMWSLVGSRVGLTAASLAFQRSVDGFRRFPPRPTPVLQV